MKILTDFEKNILNGHIRTQDLTIPKIYFLSSKCETIFKKLTLYLYGKANKFQWSGITQITISDNNIINDGKQKPKLEILPFRNWDTLLNNP